MKKIPTIFERDWTGDRRRVVNIPNPTAIWVFEGEGWPTRKIDGTCCMVRDGKLYKRRELKSGEAVPAYFEVADLDEETGKTVGWMPVTDEPSDRWHREALDRRNPMSDGTYELVGPKIQGNPEGYAEHDLVPHSVLRLDFDVPRTFDALGEWLMGRDIEGVVFHHRDGRMAKIKLRDFGLKRAGKAAS